MIYSHNSKMRLLFLLLGGATFCHNIILSAAQDVGRYITVECVDHCTITDGKINGREGDNITLKYVVNTTMAHSCVLYSYNNRAMINIRNVLNRISLVKYPHTSSIDLRHTALSSSIHGYSFTFKVTKLSTSMMGDGKAFTYIVTNGATREELERSVLKINVLYGPKLFVGLRPRYDVLETKDIDVMIQLSGNPQPKVIAHLEEKNLKVISSNGASPYTYTIKLRDVNRKQCGKNLTLKANGYQNVTYITNINVLFTPSAPNITSAYFTSENCFVVYWKKVECGACAVTYIIDVTYNHGIKYIRRSTDKRQSKICFNNINTVNVTVRVRAQVGRNNGAFSASQVVPQFTIPLSTTSTTKVTVLSKSPSISLYLIILFAVIGLILLLVIFLVVLLRSGRITFCQKKDGDRLVKDDPGIVRYTPVHVTEGDYEHISTVETPNCQPVQEMNYAELGPGGRIGEKPLIEPSLYAQVNTDGAYYPPLKTRELLSNTQKPEYAVLAKALRPPINQEPEYAISAKQKVPTTVQEPEYAVSTKARISPTAYEPEYAVSTNAKYPIGGQETIYDETT